MKSNEVAYRYIVSGLLTKLADLFIFGVSYSLTNNIIFSNIFAAIISMLANFSLHFHFTFKSKFNNKAERLLKYVAINSALVTVDTLIIYFGVRWLNLGADVAKISSTILLTSMAYFLTKNIVFS